MNNQLQHYGLNGAKNGLNGFWGDLWSDVKEAIGSFGIIGGLIEWGLNSIDGTCRLFNGGCRTTVVVRDYTLTDYESQQVKAWAGTYFTPFYTKIVNNLNGIYVAGITLEQQLQLINESVAIMSLFEAYLLTNPNNFSENANKEQLIGVSEFFGYVDRIMTDTIMNSDVLIDAEEIKVSSIGLDFSPFLIPQVGTMATFYKVGNGGINPQLPSVLTPTPEQIETLNSLPTQFETQPTIPTTIPAPTPVKSNTGLKVFLGVIAAGLLFKSLSKKE